MSWAGALKGLGRGIEAGGRTLGDYFTREHEREKEQEIWEKRRKATEEEDVRKQDIEQKQWEDRAAKTIQQNKDFAVWNQNYKADLETFAESPEMKAMVMKAALPGADQRDVMGAVAFMNAKKNLSRYIPLDDNTMKALEAFAPPGAVNKLWEKNMEAIKFRTEIEQEDKRIASQEKIWAGRGETQIKAAQTRAKVADAKTLAANIRADETALAALTNKPVVKGFTEAQLRERLKAAPDNEWLQAALRGRELERKVLEDRLQAARTQLGGGTSGEGGGAIPGLDPALIQQLREQGYTDEQIQQFAGLAGLFSFLKGGKK